MSDSQPNDVEQFVKQVSTMQAGATGLVPQCISEKLPTNLLTAEHILLHQSGSHRTGDAEWSEDVDEYQETEGRYSRERGQLVDKVPTGDTFSRGSGTTEYELWFLNGRRLFICKYEDHRDGCYDSGSSCSGYYNEWWSKTRSDIGVLQLAQDGSFQYVGRFLDESTKQRIAEEAYFRWCNEGHSTGQAIDHWLAAEHEICS